MKGSTFVAFVSLVVASIVTSDAHAEIDDDAKAVVTAWTNLGFKVDRLQPLFVEHGRVRQVAIPKARQVVDDPGGSMPGECLTVGLISHRTLDYSVRTGRGLEDRRTSAEPPRSRGGVISLARCGEARRELETLILDAKSGRGAVEVVIARGRGAAPAIAMTLTERVTPNPAAMVDPGRAPQVEALLPRVQRAAERARNDGAASVTQSQSRASEDGNGRINFQLRTGCHRLELLADTSQSRRPIDVDLELRNTLDRILVRDRSESMDGRIESCVGERTPVALVFAGAPANADLTLIDSTWELPTGVPEEFGARLRASMSRSLLHRKVRALPPRPMFKSIGVGGSTSVPFEVEPASCYLVAVATYRGEPRIVQLNVRSGNSRTHDDGAITLESSVLSFCTSDNESAIATVDARGNSVAWAMYVWRTGDASRDEVVR